MKKYKVIVSSIKLKNDRIAKFGEIVKEIELNKHHLTGKYVEEVKSSPKKKATTVKK